jgi:FKBP-type peptidyl-prolyl cis-trans isomerase SlyD
MTPNIVTFHYVLHDPAGRVLDSSQGAEPVSYLEGSGQIIEGLEEQLRGVAAGTKQQVLVPAARAYGEHDPEQVRTVSRTLLPVNGELKLGDQYRTGPDRHAPVVTVVAIDGDNVKLDANHPLAGVDLTFDVEIVAVRPATPEELESCCGKGDCDGECSCEKE